MKRASYRKGGRYKQYESYSRMEYYGASQEAYGIFSRKPYNLAVKKKETC